MFYSFGLLVKQKFLQQDVENLFVVIAMCFEFKCEEQEFECAWDDMAVFVFAGILEIALKYWHNEALDEIHVLSILH